MPLALGRRSRSAFDSDEESQSSRGATPISTRPDDAKRARRSLLSNTTDGDEESDASAIALARRGAAGSSLRKSAQRPRRSAQYDEDDSDEVEDEDVEDSDQHPLRRTPSSSTSVSRRKDVDGIAKKRKHQPGAIVRVKVTNFVTYTSAEFFPGPNLNMVIGPNGTGKSSLVCAICLGLGWGPQHLGRAKEVSEFIKNGCREATIEIELQKAESGSHSRQNPIFTRHMKREGNKSTYMINGTTSNNKQVMAVARSFSVQIDNLCQFLPQDRVVEFSQLSPVELLHSTQRAVAPELLEHHENLTKIRAKQVEVTTSRTHDKELLKNYEGRQEGQRLEVENTRRRAEIKQRLVWLEKCRPMMLYQDALAKTRAAKELQKELTDELKQLEKEVAPALRRVNEKEMYEKETLALKKQREKELKDGEKQCDDFEKEIQNCDDQINECAANAEAEKKSAQSKKREKTKFLAQIQTLTQQIEAGQEIFDPAPINEEIRQKTSRKRDLKETLEENIPKIKGMMERGKRNATKIGDLNTRLADLDTESGKQLNKLERLSRDTHAAWQWIQENQQEFQKPVFGPPMVTCSLKDPKMANVMESLLQQSDFRVITVQCQQDFDLLQVKLLEMKLSDVSQRVCSIGSLDGFRPPMPQERLQELGLDGWAIDFLEGPSIVLAMLCNERSLHQNAVGTRDISDAQYQAIVNTGMKSFVAGGTSYRLTHRVEYGEAGKATSARPIRQAQIWTNQPVDGGLKAEIQNQINDLKSDNLELKATIRELSATIKENQAELEPLEGQIEALKADKAAQQTAQVKFARLPQEKTEVEGKLAKVNELLNGVKERLEDLRAQCEQTTLQKVEFAVSYAAAVSALRGMYASLLAAELMHIEALSDFQTLKSRNEEIHNLLTTKRTEEKHAEQLAKEKKEVAKGLMKQIRRLQEEGRQLAEGGDNTLNEIFEELTAKHGTDQGYRPEDLEADIDAIKADLELVHGGDQRVIDEFEKREESIRKLKTKLESLKAQDDEIRALIHDTRELWESKLDELVGIISDKFGENFARIGCAGSVTVFKANAPAEDVEVDGDDDPSVEKRADGNGLDFANWALHISVKFREAEPLSLLDSHRQSGGERAVSTIFYLMALQSLSRAPFRVVDEINQGMDPRNERMVHGRMVDIAAGNGEDGGGGSQYFLVTPKLLSGLKYKEGMTVLCIVSGENMPAASTDEGSKVDFRRLVERARKLGLSRSMGRRVDSGVSMESSFGRESEDMYGDGDGEEGVLNRRGISRLTSVTA